MKRSHFSMRALGTLVVLAAVLSAWIGLRVANWRKLVELGGRIVRESNDAQGSGPFQDRENDTSQSTTTKDYPEWLDSILKALTADQVTVVNLAGRGVTSTDLSFLTNFRSLRELHLGRNLIDNAGLKNIGNLTDLQVLTLNRTKITDSGLAHLKKLKKLQQLTLNSTSVTDDGLRHLVGFTNLKSLDLESTSVRGPGLKHLSKLSRLESLGLGGKGMSSSLLKLQMASLGNG